MVHMDPAVGLVFSNIWSEMIGKIPAGFPASAPDLQPFDLISLGAVGRAEWVS